MTDLVIAVVLCVAVAVAYAAAALIQARHAHRTIRELTRVPVWWGALALNALGAALHVVSLGYGPLSLIQPLGVLTLVIAVPLAAAAARRKVTRLEAVGVVGTMTGLIGLSLLVTTGDRTDTLTDGELTGLLLAITVVLVVLGVRGSLPGASTLWEAVAGGMAFAVCSALCQTVVVSLQVSGFSVLLRPVLLVAIAAIGCLAVAGTVFTQRSYRNGLAAPLAVTNLVNPGTATAVGVLFLGEALATTPLEVALAVGCAVVGAFGVTQLARARDADPAAVRAVLLDPEVSDSDR